MTLPLVHAVEHRAAKLSRRVVLGLAGAVTLAVGLGFLTVSAWLVLAALNGTVFAAGVIGTAYAGIGLILLALAAAGPARQDEEAPPEDRYGPFVQMATGFAAGLEAGRAARDRAPGRV